MLLPVLDLLLQAFVHYENYFAVISSSWNTYCNERSTMLLVFLHCIQ